MNGTSGRSWVRFEIGGERCGLPIEAVAQVLGLGGLRPADVPGWLGVLPLRGGTLPVADGAGLLGLPAAAPAGRCLVLRGRVPLGIAVETVLGLASGAACPLTTKLGLPELVTAAIPAADGPTLVLDAEATWQRVWSGLEVLPDRAGFGLKPLGPAAVPTPVLVFRAGLAVDLAVPAEAVLEVGPLREGRPLTGGPKHLAGMLSWRGHLVPLVDLPARLGRTMDGTRQTLYLGLSGRAARALAVRVGEVVGQAPVCAAGGAPPDVGLPRTWVGAVARVGGRPLPILDPGALLVG